MTKEPVTSGCKCEEMGSLDLQRKATSLTHWLQPSRNDAERQVSEHIEIKGKQFLARNTPAKVSDWQHVIIATGVRETSQL